MERIIKKLHGWHHGLRVVVEASTLFPGSYDISVYRPGWAGTAFSKNGMGWEGVSFHGTETELEAIIQAVREGIGEEKSKMLKIIAELAAKRLEEVR